MSPDLLARDIFIPRNQIKSTVFAHHLQ